MPGRAAPGAAGAGAGAGSSNAGAGAGAGAGFPRALLLTALAVGAAALAGSVGDRATRLGCQPLALLAGGPARPMSRVLPCALESTAALIGLCFALLEALLGAFAETRSLARWFAAILALIAAQRGAFALDLAQYGPVWISGHFFAITAAYLAFLARAGEGGGGGSASTTSPRERRWNAAAALAVLAVSAAMHADAWLHSPAFQSGFYTASLAFAAMSGFDGEHDGSVDGAASAAGSAAFVALRKWTRLALYGVAWLSFRRLFLAVERARGGTLTTRYLLAGMRVYVLGSFLLRPRLRGILHGAGYTRTEGLQNAWIYEDFVLNGPVLLYGIVLLQCVSLDRTLALELETQVTLARKRQALAEALVAGRQAFLGFVFHEAS
jgi:hypothetical protein